MHLCQQANTQAAIQWTVEYAQTRMQQQLASQKKNPYSYQVTYRVFWATTGRIH
jgi:hypothetical protein